jgi:hypothetical protein
VLTSVPRLPRHREYFRRRFGRAARTVEAKALVDTFLVFTVLTVIVIRVSLELLGYPQLGGNGLHIAHLLWGGLLMVVAIVLATVVITRSARWAAAVVGGIGFGLFIDEVGKFVTSDNDYFFKPAFAIIYVAVVLIWLVTRMLLVRRPSHPSEALANAIDFLKEASVRELNEDELRTAYALLDSCDPTDPLVDGVRRLLDDVEPIPRPEPFVGTRLVERTRAAYARLATTRGARVVVTTIFALLTALALVSVVGYVYDLAVGRHLRFVDWANLISNCVLSVLYTVGVYALFQRARLVAYRLFEAAVLFNLFVVQVFDFADYGAIAGVELVIALVLLVTLHLIIAEEERTGVAQAHPLAAVLARTGLAPAEPAEQRP